MRTRRIWVLISDRWLSLFRSIFHTCSGSGVQGFHRRDGVEECREEAEVAEEPQVLLRGRCHGCLPPDDRRIGCRLLHCGSRRLQGPCGREEARRRQAVPCEIGQHPHRRIEDPRCHIIACDTGIDHEPSVLRHPVGEQKDRSSDRGIGLGFGGGYRKITDSTSHPRIHVKI